MSNYIQQKMGEFSKWKDKTVAEHTSPKAALDKLNKIKVPKTDKDGKNIPVDTDKVIAAEEALVTSIKAHQMKSTAKCTKDELKQLFTPLGEPVPGVEGKMGIYPSTGYGGSENLVQKAEAYSAKHKEVIPVAFDDPEKKSKIIAKFLGENTETPKEGEKKEGENTKTQKQLYDESMAMFDKSTTPLSDVQTTLHNGEQSLFGFGAKYAGGNRKSKKSKKSKRKSKKSKRKTRRSKK